MDISETDYVECIDGRKGTIVEFYTNPSKAYEIEYDSSQGKTETILHEKIKKVLWTEKINKSTY